MGKAKEDRIEVVVGHCKGVYTHMISLFIREGHGFELKTLYDEDKIYICKGYVGQLPHHGCHVEKNMFGGVMVEPTWLKPP